MATWEILYIYRARLRARLVLVQELLAILGIGVGVALLFASQVASTSLSGSARALTGEIAGKMQLELIARGPEGFEAGHAAGVAAHPRGARGATRGRTPGEPDRSLEP
jgi:putative ABC transport system permease protein